MTDIQRLDLDALEPEKAIVTLGGREYMISPPSMGALIKLVKLSNDMKGIKDSDEDGLINAIEKFKDIIGLICPELKDVEMTPLQIQGLMAFIFNMVTPPEQTMLKENGITPADEKKNIDSVEQ